MLEETKWRQFLHKESKKRLEGLYDHLSYVEERLANLEARETTVMGLTKCGPSDSCTRVHELVQSEKSRATMESKVAAMKQQLAAETAAKDQTKEQLTQTRELLLNKQVLEGHLVAYLKTIQELTQHQRVSIVGGTLY